jgi:hypothetical protein
MQPVLKNTTGSYSLEAFRYFTVCMTWLYRYHHRLVHADIHVIFPRSFFFVIHTVRLTLFSRERCVNVQNHHYALDSLVQ